jgi:hypothetical protein
MAGENLSVLEARIAALETKITGVASIGGLGRVANFSAGSCTNNCTAACTMGCTKGCTGTCIADLGDLVSRPEEVAVTSEALGSYEKLARS